MNNDTLTDKDAERLSRAWRAVSAEHTPAELDRAVLQDAREALSDGGRAPAGGWLAPLSVAAALVLGIAVIIEMPASHRTGDADDETRSAPAVVEEHTSAPKPHDRSLRKAGSTVASPARQGKVQSPVPIGAGNDALNERTESVDAGADARIGHCDSEDTSSADVWWSCIEALRDSGEAEAAASELLRLQDRFPESRRER
ncbi:MAG: hypothetical protein WEA08_07670 [Woeseia sp.]